MYRPDVLKESIRLGSPRAPSAVQSNPPADSYVWHESGTYSQRIQYVPARDYKTILTVSYLNTAATLAQYVTIR